jgi:hypothetical protein
MLGEDVVGDRVEGARVVLASLMGAGVEYVDV